MVRNSTPPLLRQYQQEHSGQPHVWAYINRVLCRRDQLEAAKERYHRSLDALRQTEHELIYATELPLSDGYFAEDVARWLPEIVGFGEYPPPEEQEEYFTFIFITVVAVHGDEVDSDVVVDLRDVIELDDANEFPGIFPGEIEPILLTPTGTEIRGADFT